MGNINQRVVNGTLESSGAWTPNWTSNLVIVNATTTNTNDSIKITGQAGTALSAANPGYVTFHGAAGTGLVQFQVTADVTINLTGAHWGWGTTGDVTGGLLRVLAINDNATLRWGVALLGGRRTLLTTDTNATATNINLPEEILCTAAVASATNYCFEIGYFRVNFDDTGGAAEDLHAVQTGVGDIITGSSADGYWQPNNSSPTGFSGLPSITTRWTQHGRTIIYTCQNVANGTSDATSFTLTLPAKSLNATGVLPLGTGADNGSTLTGSVYGETASAGITTLTLYTNGAGATWTGANAKGASLRLVYEVGPAASFIE